MQAALFEATGYADWELDISIGERDNMTDGELHLVVNAKRLSGSSYENGELGYEEHTTIGPFEVHGNEYSFESVFDGARKAIGGLK